MYLTGNDVSSSGGGILMLYDSTTEALTSLGHTLNFIYSWIQYIEKKYLWRTTMNSDKINKFFKKSPVTITEPYPGDYINKGQK